MKSPTPKEELIQWFERVWNSRDKDAIPLMMTDDAVAHLAGGTQVHGTARFSGFHDTLLRAFPDISVRILRSVGDDTQACRHGEVRGRTMASSPESLLPIKKVSVSGMSFVTVRDGKITEGWDCWDLMR